MDTNTEGYPPPYSPPLVEFQPSGQAVSFVNNINGTNYNNTGEDAPATEIKEDNQGPLPTIDGTIALSKGSPTASPGLEQLSDLNELVMHQETKFMEELTGYESENHFSVMNNLGQKIFFAAEDSNFLIRTFCTGIHPFKMNIVDSSRTEVIEMRRPFRCDSWCCCPCCLQIMEVYSPPGCLAGTVIQHWNMMAPRFSIKNAAGDTIFKIHGPWYLVNVCGNDDFKFVTKDGKQELGRIKKKLKGLEKEKFPYKRYFGITFPVETDVKTKTLMLAASFLIQLLYFEEEGYYLEENN